MVYDPFNLCTIQFANILTLLRILGSIFMRDIDLHFLFLYYLCLVLVSEWCLPLRMSSKVFFHIQFFGMAKEGQALFLLYMSGRIYLWRSDPGLLLVLRFFFLTEPISLLATDTFIFCISSWIQYCKIVHF